MCLSPEPYFLHYMIYSALPTLWLHHQGLYQSSLRGARELKEDLVEFVDPKRCGYLKADGSWSTDCISINWCNVSFQPFKQTCLWRRKNAAISVPPFC